jgi:hypothetical protein
MKRFFFLFAVFVPLAFFYVFLERTVGDSWVSVGIFAGVLIAGRLVLFLYRRSRGIKDTYLDD